MPARLRRSSALRRLLRSTPPQSGTFLFFFFNDPATTEIYTLSLHDALPIRSTAPIPSEAPMSRQPKRQVYSPRRLTTRPASTPITTINRGHCRSDRVAALVSGHGTGHQMFGTFYNVAEQHGSGHRSDAARHRRHPAGNLANAQIKIANQSGLGTGNADVDADGARFDHVSGDQAWPPCCRNHDVSPSSVAGQLDSPGVAQGDRGVLTLPRQQQSQRSAD